MFNLVLVKKKVLLVTAEITKPEVHLNSLVGEER
jgi:hypothetical protein